MRSWVLFSCEKSKQPKMLLITSSVPLEGKSTISSNLAVTLALSGSRVLLIDADLRRAGLDDIFERVRRRRVSPTSWNSAPPTDDVIKPTKTRNLWLLPAGSGNTNPGELFLGPSCDIFLRKIRTQYDYVILDSAPVLATDDTANLAPKINAVLFVVRADFTLGPQRPRLDSSSASATPTSSALSSTAPSPPAAAATTLPLQQLLLLRPLRQTPEQD